jgi:hypothetical protein
VRHFVIRRTGEAQIVDDIQAEGEMIIDAILDPRLDRQAN